MAAIFATEMQCILSQMRWFVSQHVGNCSCAPLHQIGLELLTNSGHSIHVAVMLACRGSYAMCTLALLSGLRCNFGKTRSSSKLLPRRGKTHEFVIGVDMFPTGEIAGTPKATREQGNAGCIVSCIVVTHAQETLTLDLLQQLQFG